MVLAELIHSETKTNASQQNITYDSEGNTFENLVYSTIDERVNEFCQAAVAIRAGLKEAKDNHMESINLDFLGQLDSPNFNKILFSNEIQGKPATTASVKKALVFASNINLTQDMLQQKEWIVSWLNKDPSNAGKLTKAVTGTKCLAPGRNIILKDGKQFFIHSCFYTIDLAPNTKEEVIHMMLDEAVANFGFTGR
jgi:hypothetical protein